VIEEIEKLETLLRKYGVTPDVQDERPALQEWSAPNAKAKQVLQLAAQSEIGAPGTYVIDGRIEVEQTPKLKPYFARGVQGRPGSNEHIYRTEPIVHKSVNEISSLICNATYEPHELEECEAETREIAQAFHRRLKMIDGGFGCFLQDASSFIKHGFAPFEVVWDVVPGATYPTALRFREQSTVYRWLFDENARRPVGAEFHGNHTSAKPYVLPMGNTPESCRMVVVNFNATGNNIEGVSPVRVATGLRKLKELVLQISGISYQKYGVPVATIVRDIADVAQSVMDAIGTGQTSEGDAQVLANRLSDMRSALGPVLDVPAGLKVEYQTPTGDMPDARGLLEYIDNMIALVFSNEGALLGTQSFGSYAMASVSDSKFMRAAPAYAGSISRVLTQLLHHAIRWNHSDFETVEHLPVYGFRLAGTQDASRWVADMQVLVNARVWTWPDVARRMAAANMGLPSSAFDTWESVKSAIQGEGGTEVEVPDGAVASSNDVQKTALNGAQVSSMVEVVQAVASGMLPREAAVRILMRAFQMERGDADALVGEAGRSFVQNDGADPEEEDEPEALEEESEVEEEDMDE